MTTTPKNVSWRRLALAGIGALLAGALAGPGTAGAATSVKVDCSSTSLQTAIDNADPGTTLLVRGTCAGQYTVGKDLSVAAQGLAVLDGQNGGTTLTVSSGATVQLSHVTITGGNAGDGNGGAINNSGTLTLGQSTVTNSAARWGGGIYNNSGATLTLNATTVSGNTGNEFGGGIYNSGGMTLSSGSVSNNSAVDGGGGIFSCCGFDPVTLRNTTISRNTSTAGSGGGLFNFLDSATLQNSVVSGNTAALEGGGINNNAGTTTLVNTTVIGNTATEGNSGTFGGGIATFSGTVPLKNSTVINNSPDNCAPAGDVDGCSG